MDKTAPATSSALRSKELLSPSVSEPFLFNSSALEEGGLTPCVWGFQTVIGMTSNGCSAALPEESFAFATEPERGYKLKALGTSARGDNTCPGTRTWVEGEEEDAPSFGTLPQAERSFSMESKVFRFTFGTSETTSPPEPKSLPWWAWHRKAQLERIHSGRR